MILSEGDVKRKNILIILLALVVCLTVAFFGCSGNRGGGDGADKESNREQQTDGEKTMSIKITVGERSAFISLEDNEATAALTEKLQSAPIAVNMSDYGGFEKVGALGFGLPTSNEEITTAPGDVVLYQGNQIVIFYGSNSWSYTRLGKVTGLRSDGLKAFLGEGDVTVILLL